MPNSTTRGVFTTPDENATPDLEVWLLDLAQQVEDAMPRIAWGAETVNVNAASSATTTAVFPVGLFGGGPVVVCTSRNSSFFATHGTPGATDVTLSVRHVDNTAVTSTVVVDWVAIG